MVIAASSMFTCRNAFVPSKGVGIHASVSRRVYACKYILVSLPHGCVGFAAAAYIIVCECRGVPYRRIHEEVNIPRRILYTSMEIRVLGRGHGSVNIYKQ